MPVVCADVPTFESVLLWSAEDNLAELLKSDRIIRDGNLARGQ